MTALKPPPSHWVVLIQRTFISFITRFMSTQAWMVQKYGLIEVAKTIAFFFIIASCRSNEPTPPRRTFVVYTYFAARVIVSILDSTVKKTPDPSPLADESQWEHVEKLWDDTMVQYEQGRPDLSTCAGLVCASLLPFRPQKATAG
jgi:hypothetical protein